MFIEIIDGEAYLVHEEKALAGHFINGFIFNDPNYPDGSLVPVHENRITRREKIGPMHLRENAIRIKELIDKGVEIR